MSRKLSCSINYAFSMMSNCFAQFILKWRNPHPQGNSSWGVVYENNYFITTTSYGTILTTPDENMRIPGSTEKKWIPVSTEKKWIPGSTGVKWIPGSTGVKWIPGSTGATNYLGSILKIILFRNIDLLYSYNKNKSFIKSTDGTLYAIGNEITGNEGWILKQETGGSTFSKAFSCTLENNNRFGLPAVACSGNDSCFWLTGRRGNLIYLNKQTAEIFPPSRFGNGNYTKISCMLLDRDGRSVWFGYDNPEFDSPVIIHFDGETVKKRIFESDGLYWNGISSIARDSSENLWFGSPGGVTVLRNMKITSYHKDSNGKYFGPCEALFVDYSGIVWAYCSSGIARFDGSSWKLFDSAVVSPDLSHSSYSHIIQDRSGTVWFGTEGSGLLAYKDNRWYQFTTRDGIPHNSIRGCVVDSKDNLWILTDHGIAMRKK